MSPPHISVLDLFTIGIGPSSSHTVGPMRAAGAFVKLLESQGHLAKTRRVIAELYGSLALTGKGHGSDTAVLLGLEGATPETVDVDAMASRIAEVRQTGRIKLNGTTGIPFTEKSDLLFHRAESLPFHPNGMRFTAVDPENATLLSRTYYSVGGGFIIDPPDAPPLFHRRRAPPFPIPIKTARTSSSWPPGRV